MNLDWKTTLISKGLRLNQQFGQILGKKLSRQIEQQLNARGLRLNAVDFASFIENWAPQSSREALSYALNFLRPVILGMGFRISKLSDDRIEIIIPSRSQNKSEMGTTHEAVLIAAAIEGAKTLWLRHAPLGDFHIRVEEINIKNMRPSSSPIRMRLELPENLRQSVLGRLRVMNQSTVENHIQFFTENNQLVADSTLNLTLSTVALLTSPADSQEKNKADKK